MSIFSWDMERVRRDEKKFLDALRRMDRLKLYAAVLEVQAELFQNDTINLLASLPRWGRVRCFLDAGCGPATQADKIQAIWHGQKYVGVDIEKKFIRIARKKLKGKKHFKFLHADLMDVSSQTFDVILAWAVIMHLKDPAQALRHLAGLLNPGGYLVIFDAGSNKNIVYPKIPTQERIYRDLNEHGTQGRRKTKAILLAQKMASELNCRVKIKRDSDVEVSSSMDRRNFFLYSLQVSEIVRRFYGLVINQEKLMTELFRWYDDEESVARLTDGQWLVLERK